MIERMAGPEAISATALAKDVGVAQATLSRWLRNARRVDAMGSKKKKHEGKADKRPPQRTAEDKLRIVLEASRLSEEELGAYLRRKGIHEAQLKDWQATVTEASTAALSSSRRKAKTSPEAKRVKELERELLRKEKALAEVAALLALKKKAAEIWGDGDDDTDTRNGT
jgi:transposase